MGGNGELGVFESGASNLVPGDTNGVTDIFFYDRLSSQCTRVSIASDGTQGNAYSGRPSISADGRYVAFESDANNLVSGDTNGYRDVFLRDLLTGQTVRVSVASDGTEGNNESSQASISPNGRYVAYESNASNLVSGDTNGVTDIFVYDRVTGETTRVSVASDGSEANGPSFQPCLNDNDVVFMCGADNLVPGDTNGQYDIFVSNLLAGQVTMVSVASNGIQGNGYSYDPSISGDGRYVSFISAASSLAPRDYNNMDDVFLHDRFTSQTTMVRVPSDGTQGNGNSYSPSMSSDGRYVSFTSAASNLVPGDTNGVTDIFIYDLVTGQITLVSVSTAIQRKNNGVPFMSSSCLSSDGRYIAFDSDASNLVPGDTNNATDVFVRDLQGVPPPPSILAATRPRADAANVPRRDPIVVTFSKPVVMGSAEQRFSVTPGGPALSSAQVEGAIPGQFDWLKPFTTLRFTPSSALEPLRYYSVMLSAGIRCKDGTVFNFGESFVFTTSGEPVVTAWGPKGEAVGVNAAIRVTFDQPMHRISVQKNLSSQPKITGTYAWVGKSLTFTPDTPLTPGTKYRVVVGRKSRSATGDEMGRSWVWEFTTAGAVPSSNAVSVVAAATSNGAAVTVNLSAAAEVQVQVLNIAGRPVAVLPEQSLPQGLSTLNWNGLTTLGTKAPAGTYLVRVTARNAEGAQSQGLTTLSLRR
jgi:Tol biopolymer transport system component